MRERGLVHLSSIRLPGKDYQQAEACICAGLLIKLVDNIVQIENYFVLSDPSKSPYYVTQIAGLGQGNRIRVRRLIVGK